MSHARKQEPASGIEAFIIAGGESKRFGSDKTQARFRGKSLLGHAMAAVESLGLTPRIIAPHPEPFRHLSVTVITDERPGRGPAEALRVALGACQETWALLLAADMPWVDGDLLKELITRSQEELEDSKGRGKALHIVCSEAGGRRHPFPGLYRRTLLPDLKDARSLQYVLDRTQVNFVTEDEYPGLALKLKNVNRPQDLE